VWAWRSAERSGVAGVDGDESAFLRRFDAVYKAVNDAVDMNNNDLVLLVRACL
jgi:hypothetical protein